MGEEDVEDTPYDFRVARPLRDLRLDDGFGDLERDRSGVATAVVRDPATGQGVALWVDRHHPWLMVFSADAGWDPPRQALAVEPMTAPPDAFRSGRDLVSLAPAGQPEIGGRVEAREVGRRVDVGDRDLGRRHEGGAALGR